MPPDANSRSALAAETMDFISGGACVSRHSGFVNLYSYCPKMILLIILHNDSADIIPRGVFVNEVHRKKREMRREIV